MKRREKKVSKEAKALLQLQLQSTELFRICYALKSRMLWLLSNPTVYIDFENRNCLIFLVRELDALLANKKVKKNIGR